MHILTKASVKEEGYLDYKRFAGAIHARSFIHPKVDGLDQILASRQNIIFYIISRSFIHRPFDGDRPLIHLPFVVKQPPHNLERDYRPEGLGQGETRHCRASRLVAARRHGPLVPACAPVICGGNGGLVIDKCSNTTSFRSQIILYYGSVII
jgi:hypothetical protein